jgi:fructose-1,6-bisphosphatase/inositol monophosphatase family enzyme
MGDKITLKRDGTPVGSLDHLTLAEMRAVLREYFPGDNTVGEEDAIKNPTNKVAEWYVDGLDGTGNRRMGLNSFGGAAARRLGDRILYMASFLAVDWALRKNGFIYAEAGKGAWEWYEENQCYHKLRTAAEGELERITVMLEGSSKRFFKSPEVVALGKTLTVRPGFSSCVAAAAVARGKASALVTVNNEPWDNLPSALLIQEAGGIVTDWDGNPLTFANSRNIIAAGNAADHTTIMQTMKGGA